MDRKSIYTNVIKNIPKPEGNVEFQTSGRLNICLIECRIMNEIEYVLNAVLKVYKSNEIGLTIVCGNTNASYVSNIFRKWRNLKIINIGVDNLNRSTYSALLKMPTFWERFYNWSHVLIYQTDALIINKIDDIYFDYDYVGAPWKNINNWLGKNKPKYNGGNGGFSLRNVSAMKNACEIYRNIPMENIDGSNEDAFFCSLELHFPTTSNIHSRFSIEEIFHPSPIGGHQIYRYITDKQFSHIISYITDKLKVEDKFSESESVLIFNLFGGINGVGFYNQIFSLELAIYMSIFFGRKLHLVINQPIACMGLCDWSFGTIFDYILDIKYLLPHGCQIFRDNEVQIHENIYDIDIKEHMSSCYYVDKQFRTQKYQKDINEFSYGRKDVSNQLDILFDKGKPYVRFKNSNASRIFYNFYTCRENYIIMNKIAKHVSKTNDIIHNVFTSLTLPKNYIAIHFRFGDIDKNTQFINKDNEVIKENIIPWLTENNTNKYPLIIMTDRESNDIIRILQKEYNVILTSSIFSCDVFNNNFTNSTVAKFLVEKKICEKSNIFLGTRTSTVSVHINYMNYLNFKPYRHYVNYKSHNFNEKDLQYKEIDSHKHWSWTKFKYDIGHPIAWTLFFKDNVYR